MRLRKTLRKGERDYGGEILSRRGVGAAGGAVPGAGGEEEARDGRGEVGHGGDRSGRHQPERVLQVPFGRDAVRRDDGRAIVVLLQWIPEILL